MKKSNKIDSNIGKQLFELLGELDENMVEDAWAEHDEEVIIIEQKSPMRFVKAAAAIAAGIVVVAGGFYGYSRLRNVVGYSPAASLISEEAPAANDPSEPQSSDITMAPDEPTIFVGLDGQTIMNHEVTKVEGTDKAAEDITLEDTYASAVCVGFHYFREPTGIAYNNIQNPEMFDGKKFIGEMPENTNEWKRLYVGDEICGLKLKKAAVEFRVSDSEHTEDWAIDGVVINAANPDYVKFEGTIEIEGFLCARAPDTDYGGGGSLSFYPTEDKLPRLGCSSKNDISYMISYGHETEALQIVNELPSISVAFPFANWGCEEIEGLDPGDGVLARVTFSNISYTGSASVSAQIEDVKVLSEPLVHVDSWTHKFSETGAAIPRVN